ncbi:MAG TPA: arsenite methyltransferase [Candidatus Hydrogenedentes bacterium]|nr:arsenite methyltransferase [Candidatus Hydrogenedentota bacterium]HOH32689.1 arsenite methyltransferase [Candidatus Hydrogenedentota bacterium]HPA05297.1 arsenite methyltransferase [Candidatus Hydrogenedentota bacterium]
MNDQDSIREKVRTGYAAIATGGGSCCGPARSCCGGGGDDAAQLAQAIGYDAEELAALPEGANMGLSCGNPVVLASLNPGETVVDLGSGGGFDVFIAGRRLGPEGRAIGVDMTAEMVAKARRNAEPYRQRTGFDNVEFRLGEIEHLPIADNAADVVISNCVINLSPDKPQVWREIARVLKPGGRVAVSDLALLKPLPPEVRGMVEALVGCIAGAVMVEETQRMAEEAGLRDIRLTIKPEYIDSMTRMNDPLYRKVVESLPDGARASDYVVSLEINARKPPRCCCGG